MYHLSAVLSDLVFSVYYLPELTSSVYHLSAVLSELVSSVYHLSELVSSVYYLSELVPVCTNWLLYCMSWSPVCTTCLR